MAQIEARLAQVERSNEQLRRNNDELRECISRLEGLRTPPGGAVRAVTLPEPAGTYDAQIREQLQSVEAAIRAAWPQGRTTIELHRAVTGPIVRFLEDHGYLVTRHSTQNFGAMSPTKFAVVWDRSTTFYTAGHNW